MPLAGNRFKNSLTFYLFAVTKIRQIFQSANFLLKSFKEFVMTTVIPRPEDGDAAAWSVPEPAAFATPESASDCRSAAPQAPSSH